jgi:hypothetical protein
MAILRILLLVFNAAVVTFLIYEIIRVAREPMEKSKKILIIVGGSLLLLAPFGMFLKFFAPTFQYFIIYPIAISLFIYLSKRM